MVLSVARRRSGVLSLIPAGSFLPVVLIVVFFLTTLSVSFAGPSLQGRIDTARDGDIVVVPPGTYYENVDFKGKNITLRSRNPADPAVVAKTIIDGGGKGSVVTFARGETNKAMLEGFTLRNGRAPVGGGILIRAAAPVVRHNVIQDNVARFGGGVAVIKSTGTVLEKNRIERNRAIADPDGKQGATPPAKSSREGGALPLLVMADTGGSLATDTPVRTDTGSSILLADTASPRESELVHQDRGEVLKTVVTGTVDISFLEHSGGGVASVDSYGTQVQHNTFKSNLAEAQGGGFFHTAVETPLPEGQEWFKIHENRFEGNIAGKGGGGVDATVSPSSFSSNVFDGNVSGYTFVSVTNTSAASETVTVSFFDAGAVRLSDTSSTLAPGASWVLMSDNRFTGNKSSGECGALTVSSNVADKTGQPHNLVFFGNRFEGNHAQGENGGAVCIEKGGNWSVYDNDKKPLDDPKVANAFANNKPLDIVPFTVPPRPLHADVTDKSCPEPMPVVIGPKSEFGGGMGRTVEKLGSRLIGGALGGLFGGSVGIGGGGDAAASGPDVVTDPVEKKHKQVLTDPASGTRIGVGAQFTDKGLLVSAELLDAPGKGTFHDAYLEDARCRRLYPVAYDLYKVYEDWWLNVSWTKTTEHYVDGRLVDRKVETGGWSKEGTRDLGTFAVAREGGENPVGSLPLWRRFGFGRAVEGAQAMGFVFPLTSAQLAQTALAGAITFTLQITRPDADPVVTGPLRLTLERVNDEAGKTAAEAIRFKLGI